MQDYRILSRRERQIMNIIYQCDHASIAHVSDKELDRLSCLIEQTKKGGL